MNVITPHACVKNAGWKGFCFIVSAIHFHLQATDEREWIYRFLIIDDLNNSGVNAVTIYSNA